MRLRWRRVRLFVHLDFDPGSSKRDCDIYAADVGPMTVTGRPLEVARTAILFTSPSPRTNHFAGPTLVRTEGLGPKFLARQRCTLGERFEFCPR